MRGRGQENLPPCTQHWQQKEQQQEGLWSAFGQVKIQVPNSGSMKNVTIKHKKGIKTWSVFKMAVNFICTSKVNPANARFDALQTENYYSTIRGTLSTTLVNLAGCR